jgi:hypothetical protein
MMTTKRPATLLPSCFQTIGKGLCVAVLLASFGSPATFAADKAAAKKNQVVPAQPQPNQAIRRANLMQEVASLETKQMADWVVDSGNNKGYPFVIIDKKDAKVYVFLGNGVLRGAAPALLGMTVGDDSFPGVGDKPLSAVTEAEKTTPAGRFLAASDKNIKGVDIIWIDYEGAVSMHAVVKGTEVERRAERLASPLPSDRRISYGCVNVPVNFFSSVVLPSFKKSDGIVYVLPEVRSTKQVFASYYDVDAREKKITMTQEEDPIAKFASQKTN